MKLLIVLLAAGLCAFAADIAPAQDQIASAILAAPKEARAGAGVIGYTPEGKETVLRKGTNELICLADDPTDKSFSVACYHKDLEPFMKRGRELNAEGSKGADRHKMRWKEVDEGKVPMPRDPRILYVITGKGFDAASGTIIDSYLRWVIYTPYATAESTGLPIKGAASEPWLMYPGTAGAHIMISPPRAKQ